MTADTDDTTPPTLTLLSLGAGVQSTTLALMAAAGDIGPIDGAIFADTGWEPRRVYDHLAKLELVLIAAGIPLHRVSNGDLREDAINPGHRYASIPYYIQNQPGPCKTCAGSGRLLAVDPDAAPDDAGSSVYCPKCKGTGRYDGRGIGRRQCTSEYKLAPIGRKVRELLGASAPKFRTVPKGMRAEQWVGFSTDEAHRANPVKDAENTDDPSGKPRRSRGVSYLTTRYPLLDLGMSRDDCDRWLRRRGWTSVAKSACLGCPFHGNRGWRDMRDNRPEEWADVVEFDAAIRTGGMRGGRLHGEAFLHSSRVPLAIAPINRVTRNERAEDQTDIFSQLADLEEEGDPDGCNPYGCRSGAPVGAS